MRYPAQNCGAAGNLPIRRQFLHSSAWQVFGPAKSASPEISAVGNLTIVWNKRTQPPRQSDRLLKSVQQQVVTQLHVVGNL